MQGIAKSVLITILVSICFLLFTNLIFFFSWYSTLILETFNLTQVAASDNYIKQDYYEDALDRLQDRPIFREKANDIAIKALNDSGFSAIGDNDEIIYETAPEMDKPYRQRGQPIEVEISAVYPLTVTLWGKQFEQEIPVSFSLTTSGLKHYKDLDYYFD